MEFSTDRSCRSFDLVQLRLVVEIEQPIHLRRMDSKFTRQIGLACSGFDHGPIKFKLGGDDGREHDQLLSAAGRRWCGNFLARSDPALQGRCNCVSRAHERIAGIFTESGYFREIGSGDEHRSVTIASKLHGVAQDYFFSSMPSSLRIFDQRPIAAPDQEVPALAPLESTALSGKKTASLVTVH